MMISDKFFNLGIQVKGNKTEQKCKCPNCVTLGKTNINDTCLSINLESGLYNCHKCSWKGCVAETNFKREEMQIIYKIPTKPNISKLTDEALKYFQDRGIGQEVVLKNKIASTSDGNGVLFPYFRNGQLINYKTRLLKEKIAALCYL